MAANTVTVRANSSGKTKGRLVNFVVSQNAKVIRDGKECAVKDLKKGDPISVTFSTKPGCTTRHVTQVEVGKPAAK